MIEEIGSKTFHIYTENTSYIFSVEDTGYPEHIYYGKRLRNPEKAISAIREKHLKAPALSTVPNRSYGEFTLNDTMLEFSTEGKGDYRIPAVRVMSQDKGERTLDLKFSSFKIYRGIRRYKGARMPQAVASDTECETLEITYLDKLRHIRYVSYYTAFHYADVITRRNVFFTDFNPYTLCGLASLQLDIRATGMKVTSFNGTWGREKQERSIILEGGTYTNESRAIASGEADPAVILEKGSDAYLVTLVYSGAHKTTVTATEHGMTHVVAGLNNDLLSVYLDKDECFESPEAVMIYSPEGRERLSALSRSFIEHHIRRGPWKNRLKPVMLNILHYDAGESQIFRTAKEAKALGIEGIVVDDGWFGARSDEKSSLGDWYADTRSFPSGMQDLANEIHYMGLMFGLWFEMEGVSENSMLYKKHPDWILGRSGDTNAVGRSEQLLDLTREDVREWMIETVSKTIEYCNLDYIRWSLSRFESDMFSKSGIECQSLHHDYILGLYQILDTLTKKYPNLYLEVTMQGGLRLDLGMLSYAATVRMTECTDSLMRLGITEGATQIYPLSVLSTAVGTNPDRYTGRSISLESSFNTAVFGALQYSVDLLGKNTASDKLVIKSQVDFYKAYRLLFQHGSLKVQEDSSDKTVWTLSNYDGSAIMALYFMKRAPINASPERLRIEAAREDYDYSFIARDHFILSDQTQSQENEYYMIPGDALKWAGIALAENSSGIGVEDGMRLLSDNTSRLYIIKKVEKK